MNSLNQPLLIKERFIAIRKILNILIEECHLPFTLAICGSTAFGCLTESSDVELLIIVDSSHVQTLIKNCFLRETFKSFADDKIAKKIEAGEILALRLPEAKYCGFVFSINVYTKQLCRKIAALTNDKPVKFRNEVKNETVFFRGFGNAKDEDIFPFQIKSQPFERGALSTSAITTTHRGNHYFRIYVDKFLTAVAIWDELGIQNIQTRLDKNLHCIASRCGFENAYGFLYRYKNSNSDQRMRLGKRKDVTASDQKIFHHQEKLCQVSGPSGVGKDTIIDQLKRNFAGVASLVPYTTRSKRPNDQGQYHFVSDLDFCKMIIQDQFLFWHYDGNDARGEPKYYGLTRQSVESALLNNEHVLFSIGRSVAARFFKSRFPSSKAIFLRAESDEQITHQIIGRGGEDQAELEFRLANVGVYKPTDDSVFDHFLVNRFERIEETMRRVARLIGVKNAR